MKDSLRTFKNIPDNIKDIAITKKNVIFEYSMSKTIIGGLIGHGEKKRMIAIQEMRNLAERAHNICIEQLHNYLPSAEYSRQQYEDVCNFVVEHNEQLRNRGYDTRIFLNMFAEMVDKLKTRQGVGHNDAFTVVMRASMRLISEV